MKKNLQKTARVILLAGLCSVMFFGVQSFTARQTPAYAQTTQTPAPAATPDRCKKFAGYFSFTDGNGKKSSLVEGLPNFCSTGQFLAWAIEKLLLFAGTVAVLFLIVGGFFYIGAAGNEEQIEKGKKILINSVIGLVIILMATAIVRIVAGTLNGSTISGSTANPPVVNTTGN